MMASATFSCDSLPPRMQSFQESLTVWATLLGAIAGLVGLIQSRTWLAVIGTICLLTCILIGSYARRERHLVEAASLTIDRRSLDSLNMANLRRRTSKSLVVQDAHHTATIHREDLQMTWRYAGFCGAERETGMEFSLDSDNYVPFNQFDCFAYDLQRDPTMKHKIRPFLIGTDGICKKIAVPFLEPLSATEPFGILLQCTLPGCMTGEVDYYISTLSFGQRKVARSTVRLRFIGELPDWVRVYEYVGTGSPTLLSELRPSHIGKNSAEYLDSAEDLPGESVRVYVFRRGPHASAPRT